MSQFFLCNNPLAVPSANSTAYIYNYNKPRFFAHVLTIDVSSAPLKHINYAGTNKMIAYERGDGNERLFIIMVDQNLDRATVNLRPAVKEAALWYTKVLNMEDAKIYGKSSSVSVLTDLNVLTPGLQIVHLQKLNKYIVSSPGGVKSFDDVVSMDTFMNKTLGYSQAQLEDGYFNAV